MEIKSAQRKRGRPPGPYTNGYKKLRVGADPEFEVHREGVFLRANTVLDGLHSPLGVDGIGIIGEVRPCIDGGGRVDTLFYDGKKAGPGLTPIIEMLACKLSETDEVFAGSGCHSSLGGHIHFSGVNKDQLLVAALDRLIAVPFNEVSNTGIRRASRSSPYGHLGETRPQPWGFEYRSPCSWISTPDLVKGVLSIAWLLAQAQKHGCLDQFKAWDDFFQYPRKGHARNVKKLALRLSELKLSGRKLEQIELLKAWDKRHLLQHVSSPERPFQVTFEAADDFMADITADLGTLFSSTSLKFVGARRERSKDEVVFLPEGLTIESPGSDGISYLRWELPWIGLSWTLRENVALAEQVVRGIVRQVNRQL